MATPASKFSQDRSGTPSATASRAAPSSPKSSTRMERIRPANSATPLVLPGIVRPCCRKPLKSRDSFAGGRPEAVGSEQLRTFLAQEVVGELRGRTETRRFRDDAEVLD